MGRGSKMRGGERGGTKTRAMEEGPAERGEGEERTGEEMGRRSQTRGGGGGGR